MHYLYNARHNTNHSNAGNLEILLNFANFDKISTKFANFSFTNFIHQITKFWSFYCICLHRFSYYRTCTLLINYNIGNIFPNKKYSLLCVHIHIPARNRKCDKSMQLNSAFLLISVTRNDPVIWSNPNFRITSLFVSFGSQLLCTVSVLCSLVPSRMIRRWLIPSPFILWGKWNTHKLNIENNWMKKRTLGIIMIIGIIVIVCKMKHLITCRFSKSVHIHLRVSREHVNLRLLNFVVEYF